MGSLGFKSFTETNRSFWFRLKFWFFEYFRLVLFEILVNLVRTELTDHRTENQNHYLIFKNKLKTELTDYRTENQSDYLIFKNNLKTELTDYRTENQSHYLICF